jgi:hypothetical protein
MPATSRGCALPSGKPEQVPRPPALLSALLLGLLGYLLTDRLVFGLIVGLGVGAFGWWLVRRPGTAREHPQAPSPPPRAGQRRVHETGIRVVCKQVTPLRQEWVSVKTGRLYDVLSRAGLPDAHPGDLGRIVIDRSGYRVEPLPDEGAPQTRR